MFEIKSPISKMIRFKQYIEIIGIHHHIDHTTQLHHHHARGKKLQLSKQ